MSIGFAPLSVCISILQLVLVSGQTNPVSVAGLLGFKSQVQDPSSVLASWQADTPPCNTSNCNYGATLPDCNWAGIACENWQIVALTVPCTSQPNGNPGDCALQTKVGGFPLNALAHVTSLRAIDLDGNALAGTLPAVYASNLEQLTVLLVGSNQLTGALPASWSNLSSMAVADFGNNNIAGQLPGSWGQWTSLRGLRVTANFLKGPLPVEWGNWSIIEQLQLGCMLPAATTMGYIHAVTDWVTARLIAPNKVLFANQSRQNMFTGTVPGSWSDMLRLQDLELDYNCGLCGALPSFFLQATGQLSIDTAHCSIGRSCGHSNCSSPDSNTVLKAVLGTAAASFVLAILLLRQWQVRRWNVLGYDISATIEMRAINRLRRCCGLAPIVAPQRTSSSRRVRAPQDVEANSSRTPRRRRQKAPQPTLVIMPDGMGLCFAVRLPDGKSTKDSMLDQPANSQHGDSIPQQSTVGSTCDQQQQQQQQQQESRHYVSGHMQPPAAVATGSDVQSPVPADIELGNMAGHEAVNLPGQPEQRPVQG